ncbi:hypothetical protein MPTK1_6g00840 [Marchantia polymorpha subsp. ruderalis]|uniref:Endonuclease/exonuclease/phosphatase domain-containing protein n=2 Tax=Marchantia polymorpha TaxID=3197 RepID=A0AAF6BM71_MARPO|nr:hypothetical protein MARPO_0052s0116 [Marchantia polymorpha]BBN13105.1 hypothetical protein Mp_6g00840 [Marchantia polymorpha subsp. ruderalis]|eukprot:PTQ38342.1 hypothetical protein MARPO_0052s0116 [Marchantia polymorpha]
MASSTTSRELQNAFLAQTRDTARLTLQAKMEKVRGRLKKFRHRFEQKIDQIPSCFKPKKDMPKLIYTVMDNRECESLLCQNYAVGEGGRPVGLLTEGEKQRGRERLLSDVSFWEKDEGLDSGNGSGNGELWNMHADKEGPTIRLATFDVALFNLAPAIPADHPCAAAAPDQFQSTPAHYLSSESSIFSCKSKSTSSEASSGMTFFSNSRESSDSAETCAVLSHLSSKPTQSFPVLNPCALIVPKVSPVKQAAFDIRKAWRASPLAAKTRAICHFKPGSGRSSSGIHGPFYHSKLNPVFSLSSDSSQCFADSLPSLFSSQASCQASDPSGLQSAAAAASTPDQLALACYTPVGSPANEKVLSCFSSPTPLLLSEPIPSSGDKSPERVAAAPFDGVQFADTSPSAASSSPTELSSSVSPQDGNFVSNSALTSTVASPCSPNLSSKEGGDPASLGANYLSILDILLEVDADIIALQEVRAEEERGMKPLSELAEALGMEYAYAESWAPDFGNAVLSRWPIKSASVQQIHDDTDYRNVLKVVVSVPLAGDLHFYCTQLDHLDEDWRMKQIDSLTSMVPPNQPHILTGNLNALNQSDYSKERWEEIAEFRKKNNKVLPRGDVMKRLFQEKRYSDAKDFALGSSPTKSHQIKEEVQGTCQNGTRVDYILGSQKLPFDFIPGSYLVVPSRGTSNHDLVMVDLQPHFHS